MIETYKDGTEKKIKLFVVVELFRFLSYAWTTIILAVGGVLTVLYSGVDYTAVMKSIAGSMNVCVYIDFPPATYVLPAMYSLCPILVFLYTIASIFRAWISKEEKKMSQCSFILYVSAFAYYFQSALIASTSFAVQPNPKIPVTIMIHTLPFTNLIVGLTLMQYATTWFICQVSYFEEKKPKYMPLGNYVCSMFLTFATIFKVVYHINMMDGLELNIQDEVVSNGWIWNVNDETIGVVGQFMDVIWNICALVLPMIESGYLAWKRLDSHGLIFTIEDNRLAKREYEPVPDQ